MDKKNSILIIAIFLEVLLGLSITLVFYKLFFLNKNNLYFYTWILAYIILFIPLLFVYSFYSDGEPSKEDYKINAIIPVYNEDENYLILTIQSILEQTYDINKIYIVDDGSREPVKKFSHPKLVWLKQKNSGKRQAQALALSKMDEDNLDFILTVDSDSVIEKNAVSKFIAQFEKNPKLKGITGLILTSNFRENILTRISDLNIGISCTISRPIRSKLGSLETTSGALSLYRKEIIFKNIDDYLTSGTYSDDRQLCFYSLKEGDVIALTDSTVSSTMPSNFKAFIKQRLRWQKGSWVFFPKQIRELSLSKKIFPIISMIQTLLILSLIIFFARELYYKNLTSILYYYIIRCAVRMCQALIYIGNEKRMSFFEKLFTLVIITPLEVLITIFILSPLKYIALFYLKDSRWLTR